MRAKILDMDIDDMISQAIEHVGVERYKEVCQQVSCMTGLVSQRTIAFYIALVGLREMEKELGLRAINDFQSPVDLINNGTFTLCYEDSNSEFIYFIQDEDNEHVKIGYSKNPVKRLGLLQGGNSSKLRILAIIPGDRQDEREFHEHYEDLRIRGEWFKPDKSLLDFISSIENKTKQTCPDCGQVHDIFKQATWRICCILNFDFPFPIKIIDDLQTSKRQEYLSPFLPVGTINATIPHA